MRVKKGLFKGKSINNNWGSDVRPTTDLAKKGLFDFLSNHINFDEKTVVDLFAGSGMVSLTFLSVGVSKVTSIDKNKKNCQLLQKSITVNNIQNWEIICADAINWVETCENKFDIVFADPPYMMEGIHLFKDNVIKNIILPGGWFILEHHQHLEFNSEQVFARKQYGKSCFSIFNC